MSSANWSVEATKLSQDLNAPEHLRGLMVRNCSESGYQCSPRYLSGHSECSIVSTLPLPGVNEYAPIHEFSGQVLRGIDVGEAVGTIAVKADIATGLELADEAAASSFPALG
jgi:hypothetical protein